MNAEPCCAGSFAFAQQRTITAPVITDVMVLSGTKQGDTALSVDWSRVSTEATTVGRRFIGSRAQLRWPFADHHVARRHDAGSISLNGINAEVRTAKQTAPLPRSPKPSFADF